MGVVSTFELDDPASTAARVAPEVDRLRLALIPRVMPALVARATEDGIDPSGAQILMMLRNVVFFRRVEPAEVTALFRYQPDDVTMAAVASAIRDGLLDDGDGPIGATDRGREIVAFARDRFAEQADQVWHDHAGTIDRMLPLMARVLDAAAVAGGDAFAVLHPVYEPPDTSASMLFAERLTPMRFHRYDAHVAAWRAAGLDAAGVEALEDGPVRVAIEADTNRRDAPPYAALDVDERVALLEGLVSLPS
jgi:hypothetical protein